MSAAITFSNVSKQFPGTSYYAVDQLSFSVEEGEFVTILGSSGCGKTTLLKMINRLYEPDEGNIYLFGENTAIGSIFLAALKIVCKKISYI